MVKLLFWRKTMEETPNNVIQRYNKVTNEPIVDEKVNLKENNSLKEIKKRLAGKVKIVEGDDDGKA